jgi:tetratricopeptide (TPR) repeat protein
MLKARKKLSKKEIKEDKLVQTTMQVKTFVEDNYKQVTGITAAIIVVIASIVIYNWISKQVDLESSAILGQAQLEYQNLNYGKARTFLNRLSEEYPGSTAELQGLFLKANLLYNENKINEAKENFEAFTESYSGSEILLASGYAGLAACEAYEKNYTLAAKNYLKAYKTSPESISAPEYLYLAGINFTNAGDHQQAKENYQLIIDDFKKGDRYSDAKAKLILLTQK